MPHWEYSYKIPEDKEDVMVKASLREVSISPKHAVEIAREIKGMYIEKARRYLEDVIKLRRPVPFKRYNKKVPHRRGLTGWPSGRYPVKAAKYFLKLLDNLENNAEQKGLDISRLKIVHCAAFRGRKRRKYIPRAFGRATPYFDTLVHVEIVAEEV
ncbi:MAG TPA: 50S ribosomal protein L22 [Thermoproteales archaeon]|nr:50S ribosomal protein L22 [Thermoproteales archaeon]